MDLGSDEESFFPFEDLNHVLFGPSVVPRNFNIVGFKISYVHVSNCRENFITIIILNTYWTASISDIYALSSSK